MLKHWPRNIQYDEKRLLTSAPGDAHVHPQAGDEGRGRYGRETLSTDGSSQPGLNVIKLFSLVTDDEAQ